jgi:hypothetical protein
VVDLKQQTAEIRQRVCRDFLAGECGRHGVLGAAVQNITH